MFFRKIGDILHVRTSVLLKTAAAVCLAITLLTMLSCAHVVASEGYIVTSFSSTASEGPATLVELDSTSSQTEDVGYQTELQKDTVIVTTD
ncbi:MAG: hypothetical protein PHH86_10285 [Sphaerochaetaceae bacterium]|nr:hypothetical protein [Sphaerochaetaceae bacterium]NLV84528.1 hypothetical protein [Spirochaetales bacterium]